MWFGGTSRRCARFLLSSAIPAMLLIASLPSSSEGAGEWSPPVQLSASELVFGQTDGGWVYAYGGSSMAASDDNGDTWTPESVFSGRLAAVGDVLYRVNETYRPATGSWIFFSVSSDHGSTWSSPVDVMLLEDENGGVYGIYMLNYILLVYSYDSTGTSTGTIWVSRSTDWGATWSPQLAAATWVHFEDPIVADMAFIGGKLLIAYCNTSDAPYSRHVMLMESHDMGATWENHHPIADGFIPMMKTGGGSVYVTYIGTVGSEAGICFIKSDDGSTWSAPMLVGRMTDFTDASSFHTLACSGGTVFFAYVNYATFSGQYIICVYSSYDGGLSWHDLGNVVGGDGDEMFPNLMISGGRLHLTWTDAQGGGGWGGATFYRYFTLGEPIPEFGDVLLPVFGLGLICAVMACARRR